MELANGTIVQCDQGWKFGKFTPNVTDCWTVMPEGKPWGFAAYECQKLDAHMPVPKDETDNEMVLSMLKKIDLGKIPVTWLGFKLSGWPIKWTEVHTRNKIEDYKNYTNWKEGHPANNYFAAMS